MFRLQILRKFFIPSSLAATAVQVEGDEVKSVSRPCRPSELPLYPEDGCLCRSQKKGSVQPSAVEKEVTSALEEQIRVVRKELWVWHDQYKGYRDKVIETLEIAKAHTESTLEFLKEEGNYLPRVGAISLGGLTGIIFGLRGGWIRRLTYGTAGSLAMSALCYPRQASEVSHEALTYAKKYVAVTYNFIYGVKPEVLRSEPSDSVNDESKRTSTLPATGAKEKKPEQLTQKVPPGHGVQADRDLYSERSRK